MIENPTTIGIRQCGLSFTYAMRRGANILHPLFVHQMFDFAAPETGADVTMQSANHTRRLRPAHIDLKISICQNGYRASVDLLSIVVLLSELISFLSSFFLRAN